MDIYFDAEFDAIRCHKGCVQCLISIGMIAAQNGVIVDRYYSLIRPKRFRKLTRVVREMTKLSDEAILQAPSFAVVMSEAQAFINRYKPCTLYSFGPDDKRTIQGHAQFEGLPAIKGFLQVVDLQQELSKAIFWEDKIVSPTLSLDDLKYIYGVTGEVVHNALNDALDLMRIHDAAIHHKVIATRVQEVQERKERKAQEVKQHAQERMLRVLHERYDRLDGRKKAICFYPDVIEHLASLFQRGEWQDLQFIETGMIYQGKHIPYARIKASIEWQMAEQPQVVLTFVEEAQTWTFPLTLTYRNAGTLDAMWKLLPHII